MKNVDVAIIGAGHAGLNALKEVKKVTNNWVVINRGELGTTCARVGCMPSKAMIELANRRSVGSGKLSIPEILEKTRDLRDIFVDLVLANSTDNMTQGAQLIDGYPVFVGPDTLNVGGQIIRARKIIIATGSSPVVPAKWRGLGDRLLTSESLFDMEHLPASVGVIGLGFIGLEMTQALHRLGCRTIGFNSSAAIGGIKDPAIAREAVGIFNREFTIHTGHAAHPELDADGVTIRAGEVVERVDKVFIAVGRRPNIPAGLDRFSPPGPDGGLKFDRSTLRLANLPIYLAGDANGARMLLQDAAEEGKLAGRNAVAPRDVAGNKRTFMSIIFTDPNICQVGASYDDLIDPVVGEQRFGPNGRALAMGNNRGLIRIYADPTTGRILGSSMVGPRVEHLAHLVTWAVQMKMTIDDMLKMPFYHPVVEEALQDALKQTQKKLKLRKSAAVKLPEGAVG